MSKSSRKNGTPGKGVNAAGAIRPGCTRGSAKATISNPNEFYSADAAMAVPANRAAFRKSVHKFFIRRRNVAPGVPS